VRDRTHREAAGGNLLLRVGMMILLVGISGLAGCATNPVTGQQELSLMSRSEEVRVGRRQYPVLTQMYDGPLRDPRLQDYVDTLGRRLAGVSHAPGLPYEFNVVNSSVPNAYALPGGFVSVTRGLLLEMDHEGELAGVLGHEIAHATARHAARQHTRSVFAGLLLAAGQVYLRTEGVQRAGLYGDLGSLGARAILASYSRDQEREADRLGMLYMARAGYDPSGMVDLQELLLRMRERRPGSLEQLFSSHPLSEERIADSRRALEGIRAEVAIPRDQRLDAFQGRVTRVWKPRRPAYEHMDAGVDHLRNGRSTEAIRDFDRAVEAYGEEALFYAWRGHARTLNGQPDEGRSDFDRALDMHPAVFRLQFYSALNRYDRENYSASLDDLERADELLPGFPDVTFFRGLNHEKLGNRERAARYYRDYLNRIDRGDKADYARRRLRQWGNR